MGLETLSNSEWLTMRGGDLILELRKSGRKVVDVGNPTCCGAAVAEA